MYENRSLRVIHAILSGFVEAVLKRPLLSSVIVLLLAALSVVYAAQTLQINADTTDMLSPDLPYRKAQKEFNAAFPELANDIVILVTAPTPDEADAFVSALGAELGKSDSLESFFAPTVNPFFQQNGLLFLKPAELDEQLARINEAAPLLTGLSQDPSLNGLFDALADARRMADRAEVATGPLDRSLEAIAATIEARLQGGSRPLSWLNLLEKGPPPESVTRVVSAKPKLDYSDIQPARSAIADIENALARVRESAQWRVDTGITGKWALRSEELQSVTDGILWSFAFSLIAVAILLFLAFRSVVFAATTFLVILAGLALTAGFTAVTIGALNLISVAFVVLLLGLGVDFAIHFGLHVQERLRRGAARREAVRGAVDDVGVPLALCMPTTAFAFLAFVPTAFTGMAQLGMIAGAGVLIAFFVSLTFISAVATVAPVPKSERVGAGLGIIRGLVQRAGATLSIVVILACAAALSLMPDVRFDADPMSLRNPVSPSVQTFKRLQANSEQPPYRLNALADSLEKADQIAARAKAIDRVDTAVTLSDFVPEDQDMKLDAIDFASGGLLFELGGPPAGQVTEPLEGGGLNALQDNLEKDKDSQGARRLFAAIGVLAAEASAGNDAIVQAVQADMFRFWPQALDRLTRQLSPEPVTLDGLPAVIRDRFATNSGTMRVEIVPAVDVTEDEQRRLFVEAVTAEIPGVSGDALTIVAASETVAGAMIQATATAVLVAAVLLWGLLRDGALTALILFPLTLAGILTSALGVLIGQPYNFANVIVLPLLIGLGIDSGIHIAMRARSQQSGLAVLNTATPRAILYSTLTTIAAFGSLMLSEHRGTASMGQLLAIAIGFALLCVLIVLPVMLEWMRRLRAGLASSAQSI